MPNTRMASMTSEVIIGRRMNSPVIEILRKAPLPPWWVGLRPPWSAAFWPPSLLRSAQLGPGHPPLQILRPLHRYRSRQAADNYVSFSPAWLQRSHLFAPRKRIFLAAPPARQLWEPQSHVGRFPAPASHSNTVPARAAGHDSEKSPLIELCRW